MNKIQKERSGISTIVMVILVAVIIIVGASAVYVVLTKDDDIKSGPVTVTDAYGRVVTIESSNRIASVNAVTTEIICGIGGYSKLKGVTEDTNTYKIQDYIIGLPNDGFPKSIVDGFNNKTIVNLGGMYMISAESILLASPDLVIAAVYGTSDATIAQLESLGIPTIICKDNSLMENVHFNIDLIGKVIGKESEAKQLSSQLKNATDKVINWAKSLGVEGPSVGVLSSFGSGTTYAYSDGFWKLEGVRLLGGTNAFSEVPGMYAIVSKESIARNEPDVIINNAYNSKAELDATYTDPVLKSISAIENNRVYSFFDTANTVAGSTSQGNVNSLAFMAMFMYEDYLDFEIDHEMGNDYADYLKKFWNQINS